MKESCSVCCVIYKVTEQAIHCNCAEHQSAVLALLCITNVWETNSASCGKCWDMVFLMYVMYHLS